jgi:hypothetical protein
MSKIQISNLQPAGAELFQGGDSFLTELQATEAHRIHGGGSKSKFKFKFKFSGSGGFIGFPGFPLVPPGFPLVPPVFPPCNVHHTHKPCCTPPPHC